MRQRTLAFFILLGAALAGLVWSIRAVFPHPLPEVEAFRVRRGLLEITLPLTGVFETRTVDLAFDMPGRLAAVSVREGQAVTAGAFLASLEAGELQAAARQAEESLVAAQSDARRAQAAAEGARRQAEQAHHASRAADATAAQVRAGPRPADLRQADAAVDAASVALAEARRTLERTERLWREGAVGQAQVEGAQSQVEAAQARYKQAAAQRDLLRAGARPEAVAAAAEQARQAKSAAAAAAANVRQADAAVEAARARVAVAAEAGRAARARLDRSMLRAPFAGVVTRTYLTTGSTVAPGIPVISLAAPGGWVTAEVDESDIGQVLLGQRARITADAYPGRTFTGAVSRIGRQVEIRLGTRIVRVRIDLDNEVGMRNGTSVDVELVQRTIPDALLAPAEAVGAVGDGSPHVFIVEGDVVRRREVRTGGSNDQFVAILDGLREGERVAVAEPGRLRDGLRVRVVAVR